MVEQMGMSDLIGPRNVAGDPNTSPMARAMGGGNDQGPILQQNIDDEVDRILQAQYDRGMKIILENKEVLDQIAKTLIEKEKIDGGQLLTIIETLKPELVPAGAKEKVAEMIQRGGTGTNKPAADAELAPAV